MMENWETGRVHALIKVTQEVCVRAWYRLPNTRASAQILTKQLPSFFKYSWKKDRLVQWSTNKAEEMESHYIIVVWQTAESEFEELLSAGKKLPNTNFKIVWFIVLRKSETSYSQP